MEFHINPACWNHYPQDQGASTHPTRRSGRCLPSDEDTQSIAEGTGISITHGHIQSRVLFAWKVFIYKRKILLISPFSASSVLLV